MTATAAAPQQLFLRELPTTPKFDTSTHEIMSLFYIPALSRSTSYDRGVGYFTSNWIRMAAAGLAQLAANGGKARIIASPKLEPDCPPSAPMAQI
ncbi:MAG: hypothetical protein KKB78_10795 [Alphaproteobacteria bacterium]|nr:hypothetical protein [Alphaproteobacteria bacterium]MBU0864078.1 hypothetical protein [Alphaproteobacteria bacterium]